MNCCKAGLTTNTSDFTESIFRFDNNAHLVQSYRTKHCAMNHILSYYYIVHCIRTISIKYIRVIVSIKYIIFY